MAEKPTNYIQRLKAEKEALEAEVAALKKGSSPIDPLDATDDRNDDVVVIWGLTAREYQTRTMPKREAVKWLYDFYAHRIPTERYVPKMDAKGRSANIAPCYIKITRHDGYLGEDQTYYKDMPLWILVDRMINHPEYLQMELVRREEWQLDQDQAAVEERTFDAPRRTRKLQEAADVILANQ